MYIKAIELVISVSYNILMLDRELSENQLDALYGWVDTLTLSRPKKHINRDFSDAVMMAETIHNFFPKIVELHNYPTANSVKAKLTNWKTLNNKSLSKLGLYLKNEDCQKLASATPMAIEVLLFELMKICEEQEIQNNHIQKINTRENQTHEKYRADGQQPGKNKVQQLKEVLKLIKDKIVSVQRTIQRKDQEIKDLEDIIRMGS